MVADARPRTVAYFVESTFATPPADWDASGTEIYTIGPDPSGLERAMLPNENYVSTHMGAHAMIRGLVNSTATLGSLYLHGSPNTTAEAAQSVAIPLSIMLKCAWGGQKLGYAIGFAATGTAAAPDLDSVANFAVGDWIYAVDDTDDEGEFIQITALPGGVEITPDRDLSFTPAAADIAKAVIVCYPDGSALTEHDDADHTTMSFVITGDHAEDVYEMSGCKLNVSMGAIEAGAPSKLEAEIVVTTWTNDGIAKPALTTTPAGEAPGVPGTGDDTAMWFATKGSPMTSTTHAYAITPNLAIKHERVTGPNGTEGVHGHRATGLTESGVTIVVPYDNAYQAEFEADTRKHLLVQVGRGDSAWGLYFGDLEYAKAPKRVDQAGVTAVELEFRAHEDSAQTTDYRKAPWNLLLATK